MVTLPGPLNPVRQLPRPGLASWRVCSWAIDFGVGAGPGSTPKSLMLVGGDWIQGRQGRVTGRRCPARLLLCSLPVQLRIHGTNHFLRVQRLAQEVVYGFD